MTQAIIIRKNEQNVIVAGGERVVVVTGSALLTSMTAQAKAAAASAADSANDAATTLATKRIYNPPGRNGRVTIAERFTADGSVNSRHGGQSGQFQSVENVYNDLAFETYGYPTVLRAHGKSGDTAGGNAPRFGFTLTPADLAEMGIVPDDTTPPVISVLGRMFINEAVNQNVTVSTNLGQMWVMLRYNNAVTMTVGQSSSTDITFVNELTGVNSGPSGATSDARWTGNAASVSFTSGQMKQWVRQNIAVPATFNGKALTGICVLFFGEVLANGVSQVDAMAEVVAGATIGTTRGYLNDDDQVEAPGILPDAPDVRVQVSGGYVYVRTAWDATHDKVQRIAAGYTASANDNGAWDHDGERLIPVATLDENVASAFTAATGNDILRTGGDESPTVLIQSDTRLGGGHGLPCYQVTATAHGKAYADIGSTWSDGVRQWVLARIVDANTLMMLVVPTGSYPAWTRSSSAPSGSTLTHVSDATNTGSISFSSPVSGQLWHALQDYSISAHVDGSGDILGVDAVYRGSRIIFRERYGIVNYSAAVTWLRGEAGNFAANPTTYAPTGIDTQVQISQSFSIDWTGMLATTSAYYAEQAYTGAHLGGAQLIRPDITGGKTLTGWAPRTTTISGYDFTTGADITANNTDLFFTTSQRTDALDPVSMVALVASLSGTPTHGLVAAIREGMCAGVPTVRAAAETTDFRVSASEKVYPYVSGTATAIAAGDLTEWGIVSGTFNPALDPDLDVFFVAPEGAKHIVHAYASSAIGKHWVPVDRRLIGQPVTARREDNCTLISTAVTERGVLVDFSSTKGDFEGVIG